MSDPGAELRLALVEPSRHATTIREHFKDSINDPIYLPVAEEALSSADPDLYSQLVVALAPFISEERLSSRIQPDDGPVWQRYLIVRAGHLRRTGATNPTKRSTAKQVGSGKQPSRQRSARPPSGMKTCRECLRTKPISEFPDPSRPRCADCGGVPRSKSVRTVSGGAPGLGRRR